MFDADICGSAQAQELDRVRALLPGELLKAHMYEVIRDNWLAGKATLVARLMGERSADGKRCDSERDASLVRLLAFTQQCSLVDLISQHSLLPIKKLVFYSETPFGTRVPWIEDKYLGEALRSSSGLVKVCRKCLQVDLREQGRAYWHVDHQIHGITWCWKHQVPLSFTTAVNALCVRPDRAAKGSADFDRSDTLGEINNPTILMYWALSTRVLADLRRPLSMSTVAATFSSCLQQTGMRRGKEGQGPLLSDLAAASLPKRWLNRYFPQSAGKIVGEYAGWLDNVIHVHKLPMCGHTYILAMALLWDKCGEPLDQLLRGELPDEERRKETKESSEASAWIRAEGRYADAAVELGLSRWGARLRLMQLGLPNIRKSNGVNLREALDAFVHGTPINVAAAIASLDPDILEEVLRTTAHPLSQTLNKMKLPQP